MPRPSRFSNDALRAFATREVLQHPRDFTQRLASQFGVTRAGAAPAIRRLEEEGFVRRLSGGTRPVFAAGPSRFVQQIIGLPGVDESSLWEQHFAPWLTLSDSIANIVHYAFTEMV